MSYNKQEVYASVIETQKRTGQGLSGIIKIKSKDFSTYLDELIEEGLVIACHTGKSMGHPESNIFYLPSKGYNVWEDDEGDGIIGIRQGKGKYLHFVRLYLGTLKMKDRKKLADEQEEMKHKYMTPTIYDYLRDPEQMKLYASWLDRNHEQLEIMMNLDNYYEDPEIEFTDKEVKSITSKGWYKKNNRISECKDKLATSTQTTRDLITASEELLDLYQAGDQEKYQEKIEKSKLEIQKYKAELLFYKKLESWFNRQEEETPIQELIN